MSGSSPRCPGCGAPCDADATQCDYCGSPLASVLCPSCFTSMFKGSRYCTHCGGAVFQDIVEDASALQCPRCRLPMQALQLGKTRTAECGECGGLWINPETLQVLCNERELSAGVVSALAGHIPRRSAAPETVRYVPCPLCAKLMNRVNFAHSSGVIMDVCRKHGVWLDRGELQRVIRFVEGGGLTVQREREKEALQEEQRRLFALQSAPVGNPYNDRADLQVSAPKRGPGALKTIGGVAAVLFDIATLFG